MTTKAEHHNLPTLIQAQRLAIADAAIALVAAYRAGTWRGAQTNARLQALTELVDHLAAMQNPEAIQAPAPRG
jgi:hypothetical protein